MKDKKTMTVEDRETMTEWDSKDENVETGNDTLEVVTDGYDTDSDTNTEIAEDSTDQTAVHSGSSFTEQ